MASRHHAVTSSFAAEAMESVPMGVFVMLRSCTIRANTGKAVILMDIPINKANGRKAVWLAAYSSYTQMDARIPKKNGTTIPAWLITSVSFNLFFSSLKSSSKPMTNMNRTRPIWLNRFRFVSEFTGKRCANNSGKKYPRREGPSTIPATISPITPGCPMYLKRNENTRTVSRITMIWINKIVKELVMFSERIFRNIPNADSFLLIACAAE